MPTLLQEYVKTLCQRNIKVVYQSKNSLTSQFQFKDSISTTLSKNLCSVIPTLVITVKQDSTSVVSPENIWVQFPSQVNALIAAKKWQSKIIALFAWVRLKIFQFWHMSQVHVDSLLKNFCWFEGTSHFQQTSQIISPPVILVLLYYNLLFLRWFLNHLCDSYFKLLVVNISWLSTVGIKS